MPGMSGLPRLLRCATVVIEPRDERQFSLVDLVEGGSGVRTEKKWMAYALHLEQEVEISGEEVLALAHFSSRGSEPPTVGLEPPHPSVVQALLDKSLLFDLDAQPTQESARDQRLRTLPWWPLAGIAHQFSRWEGVESGELAGRVGLSRPQDLLARFGPPPPAVPEDETASGLQRMPTPRRNAFDELMARRATCRNFDRSAELSQDDLSTLLMRSFGALAIETYGDSIDALKKNSPSAGGLHPIEAYVLVQRVTGIAPGRYRYHALENALLPLDPALPAIAPKLLLAGQGWFADAPVLVVLAVRFRRNFWKYREHAKAYRGVLLDAGHLAQTLQLSATEQGLGAFVTAAINEKEIERCLGLDPVESGVLAVCGAGPRSAQKSFAEFDPLARVWPQS